jgi:hypothetical protein
MDPRIINDVFEKTLHICSMCECPQNNHLIFHNCPLFENNPICQEDCQISMMKDDIDIQVSTKLGKPVTKEYINQTCRNCGLNNACQNQDLVNKIERGTIGGQDAPEQEGPKKNR